MPDESEVPVGQWYRLDVDREAPIVSALVWLGIRDDLAARGATLRVQLSLPIWTPEGFKYTELDAELRETSAKKAKRLLERGVQP